MRALFVCAVLLVACGGRAEGDPSEGSGGHSSGGGGNSGGVSGGAAGVGGLTALGGEGSQASDGDYQACFAYLAAMHEGVAPVPSAAATEACEQCTESGAACADAGDCWGGVCTPGEGCPCSEGAYCIARTIGHLQEVPVFCPPVPLADDPECRLAATFCDGTTDECECSYDAPLDASACKGGTEWICQSTDNGDQGCGCGVRP